MTFPEAQEYISSFFNFELSPAPYPDRCVFKLDRVRCLLDLLGNPQGQLKIIHVAGSKGKGSTCALTASVLRAAGYKVGLYTSPHLNHYRERIRVPGESSACSAGENDIFSDMISEQELCAMLGEMKPHIARLPQESTLGELSFFELFTALAFYYFCYQQVDWVVLETGMGGRLDATNVAPSKICVITPISLEHTQYLGDTIAKIAGEKAAIIKDCSQKVILAPQEPAAQEVFRKRCAQFSIHPIEIGRDIRYEILREEPSGQMIRVAGTKQSYHDLELSLPGRHQASNAAVVLGIVEALAQMGCVISQEAVYAGFRAAFWPGRLETVSKNPLVILDCAHNRSSARNLAESIVRIFPYKNVTLVLGVSEDKDRAGICGELNRVAGRVIATKADHPRAHEFSREELNVLFAGKPFTCLSSIEEALASVADSPDIILITGSIFLVSEARRYLNKKVICRFQGIRGSGNQELGDPGIRISGR